MEFTSQDIYKTIFKDYPDVLTVAQVSKLLGVSTKTVYKLISNRSLSSIKVGREFRIAKVILLKYMKVLQDAAK